MMKQLTFFLLFLFIGLASGLEISTNSKLIGDTYYVVKGEIIEIQISGSPSEEVSVSIQYRFTLKSSGGWYSFSQDKFPIPISSSFEVRAYPVKNLTVEAKLWIFKKTLNSEAKNGVAVVRAEVPSGKYDVKFYGVSNGDNVNIESIATSKVTLDESGKFSIKYDTSFLPEGEMTAQVDSKLLKVKIISGAVPTPSSVNPPTNIPSTPTDIPTTPAEELRREYFVEIEPIKASITVNENLEITVRVKDSFGEPAKDLEVLWSLNSSVIEFLSFENKTDMHGEATAKIRAISSGDAEVKAEIPEANASYVTTISIRNEGGAPTTPQPQKTVALVPTSTTTITSETARNEKINMIPGFEVSTAISGILSVYVVFRKMQAK
jgi:hypothetical protein